MKIKPEVDMKELLRHWPETDTYYKVTGPFDEFCIVDKKTREVTQEGYGLLCLDWINKGIAEE